MQTPMPNYVFLIPALIIVLGLSLTKLEYGGWSWGWSTLTFIVRGSLLVAIVGIYLFITL